MSADEIAAVRSSFLPSIDHFGAQQGLVREADETAITFRFRLEEMWMDAQGKRFGIPIEVVDRERERKMSRREIKR